ncbi:WD domain, G-beta repeat [Stieleria bergensis]|uniref:WD domain, G-beta repeat n=2 Tax=Stieleria bergensis TaxID=2528025 RepID=A0A517ST71_9BACT|nr:WD domain, G-beta repeat [Planctomycetes bacterium SV_7m_r]
MISQMPPLVRRCAGLTLACLLLIHPAWQPCVCGDDVVSFRNDIAPVLIAKCQPCHGPKKSSGDYRVDSFERAMVVGADEIVDRIESEDDDFRMPPDGDSLPKQQRELFARWLDQEATYDDLNPKASLISIVPGIQHPAAPGHYLRSIPVTALAFSKSHTELYVSGYRELLVWNIPERTLTKRIPNLPPRIRCIDMHPSRPLLAVAGGIPGRLGEVRIIDQNTSQVLRVLHRSDDMCFSARFSPDGRKLATAGADGTVQVFETDSWIRTHRFANHSDWVQQITWNQASTRLASASRDHTAKVFDLESNKRLTSYTGHDGNVYSVCFAPKGDDVFSGGSDGKLMRWRVEDGKTVREFARQQEAVYQIGLLPQTQRVAIASGDPYLLSIIAHNAGEPKRFSPGDTEGQAANLSAAVSFDERLIAAGDRHGTVRVWTTENHQLMAEFAARPE